MLKDQDTAFWVNYSFKTTDNRANTPLSHWTWHLWVAFISLFQWWTDMIYWLSKSFSCAIYIRQTDMVHIGYIFQSIVVICFHNNSNYHHFQWLEQILPRTSTENNKSAFITFAFLLQLFRAAFDSWKVLNLRVNWGN